MKYEKLSGKNCDILSFIVARHLTQFISKFNVKCERIHRIVFTTN